MLECIEGKQIFNSGTTSVSAAGASHYMPECNHEEADTRMLIHLQDALENGANTCLVCTVDTDVIVIIVEKVHYLREQHPAADVWIEFGTGRNFRYLHINATCNVLGREKAIALPIFTQLLAVIQLLHFLGKGRSQHGMHRKHSQRLQRHFFTWLVIHMFLSILKLLDCFCVIIYDKTSSLEYVNEAQRELFCRKIEQWKQFHQHKMLFCSTVEELPTRLAFGAQVTELIRSCQAQKDMAGH